MYLDNATSQFVLKAYYAATVVFLLLDVAFGINIRLAFLDALPGWRALYYGICFACLGLMIWRPALTLLVSTIESLATLVLLILAMGIRVMSMTVTVLETGGGFVTPEEIVNFLIAGGAAWLGWTRGARAIFREYR